jgi:hypothetical protein
MNSKKFAEMIPAQTMLSETSNLVGQLVQINCNMHWIRVMDDQTTAYELLYFNAKPPPYDKIVTFPIDNQICLLQKVSAYYDPRPAGPPLKSEWLFGLSADFMYLKREHPLEIGTYGYVLEVMANDVFCTFYLTSNDFKFLT